MFGMETLEVVIGIIFVYTLTSIICSTIREGIEAWLKTRAAYLVLQPQLRRGCVSLPIVAFLGPSLVSSSPGGPVQHILE
jgi:hypothetical protein